MEFASPFDARLFAVGPPAIFTRDPSGRLRVDPERTREAWMLLGDVPEEREEGHFVLTDAATGVRMYLLVSHPALATCQPRGSVARHPDAASALAEAVQQWAVPAADADDGAPDEA